MSFTKLILKNPFRKKSRAILSITGIMIGIMVIILLGAITSGLTEEMGVESKNTEFFIMNNTVENYGTPANMETSALDNLSSVKGINQTAKLIDGSIVDGTNMISVEGMDADKLEFMGVTIINGTKYNENKDEVIIGKLLADNENKTINDKLKIKNKEYTITGIFETGNINNDKAAIISINKSRDLLNIDDDKIFLLQVSIKKGEDIEKIKSEVENKTPEEIKALSDASELESVKTILTMVDGATFAISILAIIIGGLGVINTMLMSVTDRTKEIGLLKAIGWSKKRIVFMIVSESIILTTTSFILGSIFSIAILYALEYFKIFDASYPPKIFIIAFIVAFIVGIIGGLVPAIRASRFEATEALRYE